MSWLLRLHDLSFRVFPGYCRLCGQRSNQPLDICRPCADDLIRVVNPCLQCGLPQTSLEGVSFCAYCAAQKVPFGRCVAPFVYAGAVQKLHHAFKFGRDVAAGQLLSSLMLLSIRQIQPPVPDFLIPVPIHWRRRLRRGFNQVDTICDTLRLKLQLEVVAALRRVRLGVPQQTLRRAQRTANVEGAFSLRVPASRIAGRHLVLVDDVCTTGSTARSAAGVLLAAGAERVDLWCIARSLEK